MADTKNDLCCQGSVASGEPQGTITQIAGIDAYVISGDNKNTGRAVLFICDVFGISFINNKLLADYYAKNGNLTVYAPDLFDKQPAPDTMLKDPEIRKAFDFPSFMARNPKELRYPLLKSFIQELKENHGVKKIASIGFCYGGWASVLLSGDQLVDAAGIAHPSRVEFPKDIENIKTPTLWLMAETDQAFPADVQQQTLEIIKKKEYTYTFRLYPKTVHGFAVRGDSEDEVVRKAAVDAAKDAVTFFNTVL